MRRSDRIAARLLVHAALLGPLASGCSQAAARPQLVVVVDTDLPVYGSLAEHPNLSPDAAIDTVRVDALSPDGTPYAVNEFLVPNDETLPLSFGVAAGVAASVRLRIRTFRSDFADVGTVSLSSDGGTLSVLDPVPTATVDRVVDLDLPTDGVRTVLITLHAECMGVTPVFGAAPVTCIDASTMHAKASSGVNDVADATNVTSAVGTWSGAMEAPCPRSSTAPSGAVCIRGGFTMMGDLLYRDVSDSFDPAPFPLHPMIVSSFFLDATEFTVGRLQALVKQGYAGPLPDSGLQACTWPGPGQTGQPTLPVNCIEPQDAAAICAAVGGRLPSEAQWEHAARGRGQGRLYPWGNEDPTCCMVSADRGGSCGTGIQPVASHPATCLGNLGDVSRDDVFDLAGGVQEAVRDGLIDYDQGCWNYQGVGQDLVCGSGASNVAARGGDWQDALADVGAPLRHGFANVSTAGFRCAYGGP